MFILQLDWPADGYASLAGQSISSYKCFFLIIIMMKFMVMMMMIIMTIITAVVTMVNRKTCRKLEKSE